MIGEFFLNGSIVKIQGTKIKGENIFKRLSLLRA